MKEIMVYILIIISVGIFIVKSIEYSMDYWIDREIDNAEIICADSADFYGCLDNLLF